MSLRSSLACKQMLSHRSMQMVQSGQARITVFKKPCTLENLQFILHTSRNK